MLLDTVKRRYMLLGLVKKVLEDVRSCKKVKMR